MYTVKYVNIPILKIHVNICMPLGLATLVLKNYPEEIYGVCVYAHTFMLLNILSPERSN